MARPGTPVGTRAGPPMSRAHSDGQPRAHTPRDGSTRMATDLNLEVPGATIVYDVRGSLPADDGRPPLLMVGQPMDAERVRHAGVALPRPHRRHLRPPRPGTEHAQRRVDHQRPRRPGRGPPPARRRARCRCGRPVRQQWRGRDLARTGRRAPRRRAHPGGARATTLHAAPRRRRGRGRRACRAGAPTTPAAGARGWRSSSP